MSEAVDAKEYWKVNHTQSARVLPRGEGQDHRYELAEYILSFKPKTVLEFGSSSGRNLAVIKQLDPSVECTGVDMNIRAVEVGSVNHPDINFLYADETYLSSSSDRFDVIFTCSVLDHIFDWKSVYLKLVKMADKAVVLLEPIYIKNGKVYNGNVSEMLDTTPFTYSWDYQKFDKDLKLVRPLPLADIRGGLGPLYTLFERKTNG